MGSLVVVSLLSGCGGSDDRPDLEASSSTTETTTEAAPAPAPVPPLKTELGGEATPTTTSGRSPDPGAIAGQATDVSAAIGRWDDDLAACLGPSGMGDDIGATCTQGAWEQLFDNMQVAQDVLLIRMHGLRGGRCHAALKSALDAIHGFLSGAVPTNVVWLDERQQPPSRFDLESIVDLLRPVPARMRDAAATACRS